MNAFVNYVTLHSSRFNLGLLSDTEICLSYLQFHLRITEDAGLLSFLSCKSNLQLIYLSI